MNLTYASSTSAVLRVDTSETDASTGRKSVRIESKNQYNDGLFIFDILHTPYGCGTWPAVWLADPSSWPIHGEIGQQLEMNSDVLEISNNMLMMLSDVVEAVNKADMGNQMTLHTTAGCDMNVKRKESGVVLSTDCLNSTDNNAGCGIQGTVDTYGQALNSQGGGVSCPAPSPLMSIS